MEPDARQVELIEWLKSRGHSGEEVEKVLKKLEEYDQQTVHESIFDSIDSGGLDIAAIVQQALEQTE